MDPLRPHHTRRLSFVERGFLVYTGMFSRLSRSPVHPRLENLFRKFYRGEEARGSKGGRAGLGVYIVRRLAERMVGEARAYNAESGEACIAFHHAIERTSAPSGNKKS